MIWDKQNDILLEYFLVEIKLVRIVTILIAAIVYTMCFNCIFMDNIRTTGGEI